MKVRELICFVTVLLPVATNAESLDPRQIVDRFVIAQETLKFSDVSPYIHSQTLKSYRSVTWVVIKHALDRYGADPIVAFFQGTTLEELQFFSDQEYWAFVMASSLQFNIEKPVKTTIPESEFMEGGRRFLVYPAAATLITAPEIGFFPTHPVYGFELEQGLWKMTTFMPGLFEANLYEFLRRKGATK